MVHRVGEIPLVKNKWALFYGATAIALVILLLIGAVNFASNAGSGQSAAAQGYRQYAVGEAEEVEIHIPPNFWGNVCTDKPVLVRVDGEYFRLEYPCKVFAWDKKGRNFVPAKTMGDNMSGILYVKAFPGQKLAKITVSQARKAPTEMKSAPTPAVTSPPTPPTGAMPVPPAKPISSKGGMV